jgi:hypothetical protein
MNYPGGSAAVANKQTKMLNDIGHPSCLVTPTKDGEDIKNLSFPALGLVPPQDSFFSNTDQWYEDKYMATLSEALDDLIKRTGNDGVLLYAHIPTSGAACLSTLAASTSTMPLIYLPHAIDFMSLLAFPERRPKPDRLITKLGLINYCVRNPDKGLIITNTEWEADTLV